MASHCQQHIVYNSAQHVFLPCTAKFADNTQCRIPVFDIAHDLPLCIEHARKRDAYNRLLYEQRPRKISTNAPTIRNDSITATSTSSATSKITSKEGVSSTVGVTMNNQQQQQLQPQQQKQSHKHVQLPLNNYSNGNKRPALANHQQQIRKRKMTNGNNSAAAAAAAAAYSGNTVGRPQKRVRKTLEKSAVSTTTTTKHNTVPLNTVGNPMTNQQQLPRLTSTSLKRKSSTTSLESIASNSQHSTISVTSQQPPLYSHLM